MAGLRSLDTPICFLFIMFFKKKIQLLLISVTSAPDKHHQAQTAQGCLKCISHLKDDSPVEDADRSSH